MKLNTWLIKAALPITLCLILSSYNITANRSLTQPEIQTAVNQLLISLKYKAVIKQILTPVNNLQAVVLKIPYREFPSIVLFKFDTATQTWKRSFECLAPGVQDKQSGLLDWHTKGAGVDFMAGKQKEYSMDDKTTKALVETTLKLKSGIVIPYQNFVHMNTPNMAMPAHFKPYFIDKTSYYDFANTLFADRYKKYPSSECTMFDSPEVTDCNLSFASGHYILTAITSNRQQWTYIFEDIDNNHLYLVNKTISVKVVQLPQNHIM